MLIRQWNLSSPSVNVKTPAASKVTLCDKPTRGMQHVANTNEGSKETVNSIYIIANGDKNILVHKP